MAKQQTSIEERIIKDRIDNLYKRSKPACLTLFVTSTIYVIVLTRYFAWQPLLAWYLVLLAILAGRWLIANFYEADQGRTKSLSFWLYLFRFGILAAGIALGSLNLLFFSEKPLSLLLMAIIYPYGITVGAVTMLLDFFSFFIYVITVMTPVIYQTVLAGDGSHSGTGFMTCVLILFFLRFSREYNNNFFVTAKLRYENTALLEDLEEEKNKLNNRLGRILNDSSTEIFVANANSLNCLQVNKGAIENLGYSKEEFTNINLLDIFTDFTKESFNELIAPLYGGHSDTVVHNGMNRRKDGSSYPVEARLQLSTLDVPPIIVANVQDITERTEWEEKLIYQANFDQLTGLLNRNYMQSYMHSVFTRAKRNKKKVALLFIDLDNFKNVNDTLGHGIGDEVLKQTASRISLLLRESDTAARTGGDEFTVLLENLEKNSHAEVVARKLINLFQQPFIVQGQEIHTTASIGISIFPNDGKSLNQLMQCADMAMYKAKEDGRNNYQFFSHEMRQSSEKRALISSHLRYALAKNELSIFYQPKIDISKGQIVGAEALLRWHNHELGDVSPYTFIPLAENMGLIDEIGAWVLEGACREAMQWREFSNGKLQVSVNVSPQQFRSSTLLETVANALKLTGLPREQLELEITESLLMQDSGKPLATLKILHDQGISLALDDFGTGYSSLSYLRRFPLQVLKIDRSFIRDLETDKSSRSLVDAIIAMAHSLELKIVAEGVENEQQLIFLHQRNVNIIQGYLFSPPVPAEKFRVLVQEMPSIVRQLDLT